MTISAIIADTKTYWKECGQTDIAPAGLLRHYLAAPITEITNNTPCKIQGET